jgi:hypothetical protein
MVRDGEVRVAKVDTHIIIRNMWTTTPMIFFSYQHVHGSSNAIPWFGLLCNPNNIALLL